MEGWEERNPAVFERTFIFLTFAKVRTEFGSWFAVLQVSLKTGLGHLSSDVSPDHSHPPLARECTFSVGQ